MHSNLTNQMVCRLCLLLLAIIISACSKPNDDNQDLKSTEANKDDTQATDVVVDTTRPPTWSKNAIWYQILVERFYNGDPSNDPTKLSFQSADPELVPENWTTTPWTQNWYKPDNYFSQVEGQLDSNAQAISSFDAKIALRRYGGDLQGVLDKLDYLTNLGVNAIYFNSVNDAPSLNKFDARHLRHIDVNFGPDPHADRAIIAKEDPTDPDTWQLTSADKLFIEVIAQAHKRGIRVIMDYSWNHTGHTAKQHIFAVSRRWLDPNDDGDTSDGVDGFRLDVSSEIPLGFWREYRTFVKAINPEAYLVGEIVWEKFPDDLLDPEPVLHGDVFDAVMNYRWYRAARRFFAEAPKPISPSEFVKQLNVVNKDIDQEFQHAMMNVSASHDSPRLLTSFNNKNKYKYQAKASQNSRYNSNKPTSSAIERAKLLLAHQYTYIGAPQIWAGDEMGMWGSDNPHNRKPLIWPEYSFENETSHPASRYQSSDEVSLNENLYRYYQSLISLRRDFPVFVTGSLKFVDISDSKRILSYIRSDANSATNKAFVIFNLSNKTQQITLPESFLDASRWIIWRSKMAERKTSIPAETLLLEAQSSMIILVNE